MSFKRKALLVTSILALISFAGCQDKYKGLKNGDLIFQTSLSNQSKAVQIATNSKYSHMGIIYIKDGKPVVYEASYKVKTSPLKRFIKKGEDKMFVIKRLKNSDQVLTPAVLKKMKSVGNKYKDKNYDVYFGWDDSLIYCSELVWKIYNEAAGIEIGALEKLKDFNTNHPAVKKIMQERYGEDIPWEEDVISPVSMFNSSLLEKVEVNLE